MIPLPLKELLVPGSLPFLLLMLVPALVLLFRKKDNGRAGRIWIASLGAFYWILSTPVASVALVEAMSPGYPAIVSPADAAGAGAIVVLGAGMEVHRSRGEISRAPTREGWLRVMEAARLHRLLGGVPVIPTGGHGIPGDTEAALMARQLEQLGVPAERIIKEEKARNTREHALLVPAILERHHISRFVLVTSKQHIRRSMAAFRATGLTPIPASPEPFVARGEPLEMYLPSRVALQLSERVLYDLAGWWYYRVRGWV